MADTKDEKAFTTKVIASGRIAIPINVRDVLDLKEGDMVDARVRKSK